MTGDEFQNRVLMYRIEMRSLLSSIRSKIRNAKYVSTDILLKDRTNNLIKELRDIDKTLTSRK